MREDIPHPVRCELHAISRLWLRFGIAISPGEYDRLCALAPTLRPVTYGYGDAPVYAMSIRNIMAYAVWSPPAQRIVTFLHSPKQVKQVRGG